MKIILKNGMTLFYKLIIAFLICFFLCMTINFLCGIAFSEDAYYIASGYVDDPQSAEALYTHYFADGEDLKRAQYEAQGYTVTTETFKLISESGKTVFLVVTQILCAAFLVFFICQPLYKLGFRESNLVRHGHMSADMLRGFKIGLVGNSLYILMFVALVVMGLGALPNFPITVYKLLNCQFYSFIEIITVNTETVGSLALWQYLLLLLLQLTVPVIATVSYIMGYKNINITEKIIYKQVK